MVVAIFHTVPVPLKVQVPEPMVKVRVLLLLELKLVTVTPKLFALKVPLLSIKLLVELKAS